MITPIMENITENPNTKNTEFKIIFVLLIVIVFDWSFWFKSRRVVPEIYAKKAGIIGKIHGATNEPIPAKTATAIETSAILFTCHFYIKGFFQIYKSFHFYLRAFIFFHEQTIFDSWNCIRYNCNYCCNTGFSCRSIWIWCIPIRNNFWTKSLLIDLKFSCCHLKYF